jgi:hypothetical protein
MFLDHSGRRIAEEASKHRLVFDGHGAIFDTVRAPGLDQAALAETHYQMAAGVFAKPVQLNEESHSHFLTTEPSKDDFISHNAMLPVLMDWYLITQLTAMLTHIHPSQALPSQQYSTVYCGFCF